MSDGQSPGDGKDATPELWSSAAGRDAAADGGDEENTSRANLPFTSAVASLLLPLLVSIALCFIFSVYYFVLFCFFLFLCLLSWC